MEHWPLRHLVLRTPRLELRPDDDAGLHELAELARAGIHPPEDMPFLEPWTDADPRYVGRGTIQYHWSCRATLAPDRWSVNFLVREHGRLLGTQGMSATDFAVRRQVDTGSWLGRQHQRRGVGTEMRAAVLAFAFDHLGATTARSAAFADNPASQTVSRRLGYRPDGTETLSRRGEPATMTRLLLDAATFVRPGWTLAVEGYGEECRALLGGISPG
jgi:RimJ/RimL family protein N-acetyltransferase